jgi:26S proteasome regulatory subunit N6
VYTVIVTHKQAFEAYDQANDKRAIACLKYMMLCKVLQGLPEEVASLMQSKFGVKYTGTDVEAMSSIAKAAKVRSLEQFQGAVSYVSALLCQFFVFILMSSHCIVLVSGLFQND